MINLEKKYLDEKIWVIENFLSDEEINWFKPIINDPKDWYITMRSPYNNIMNKFLGVEQEYDDKGNVLVPSLNAKTFDLPIFTSENGIWNRLKKVLPPYYIPHATLQSFKYMTDEEIINNLNSDYKEGGIKNEYFKKNGIDFAMDWHTDSNPNHPTFNLSFSLYLNDDYDGGYLEFEKSIIIKPKAGMLVGVPVDPEYKHRVTKLLGPNSRHTLYGNCWNSPNGVPVSTNEDC